MQRSTAVRQIQWLRSALAHHHCPDPDNVDNEIVVLAIGIDQYLQEVFHHLAYANPEDKVSAEDFSTLCAVLGFTKRGDGAMKDGEKGEEDEDFTDVCSDLPAQLSFKDFHSRLCGFFQVRNARGGTGQSGDSAWRLPRTEETELVERQIRLRWPRVRRRKYVSFDMRRAENGAGVVGGAAGDHEPGEVAALRELVEDLRSALQGSDARCLALEVALRQERSRTLPPPSSVPSPASSITLQQGKLVPTHRIKGQLGSAGGDGARRLGRRWGIKDPLLRELKLIRSSRDGQLLEAMKFSERLEEEVRWAYQEVRKLQKVELALRRENIQIRRRAEEAREALSMGLQRVRLIQEQAQSVPQLQSRISQLEAELHQYRSCCNCISEPTCRDIYKVGEQEETCRKSDAGDLQRAVEGRAASDEEEDDRGTREARQCCLLDSSDKGCQNRTVLSQKHLHQKPVSTSMDSRGRYCWKTQEAEYSDGSRGVDRGKKPEQKEGSTRLEKEKEKKHLSLLEEKFRDALVLLLQLRNKNVSNREFEKTVDSPKQTRSADGPSSVMQAADAPCSPFTSTDLRREGGGDTGGQMSGGKRMCQTGSISPLLISC